MMTYEDICVLADATIGVRFNELSDCGPRIGSFNRHDDGLIFFSRHLSRVRKGH